MINWRSSALYTWERTGCAATLVMERQGVPRDLQLFAVGEVVHLLLEAACRWQNEDHSIFGDARTKKLSALANSFLDHMPAWETTPKPPVGPEAAAEGLRLALGWIDRHGVPEGQPEIGLAVGADLETPVEYGSPEARWSGLIDNLAAFPDFDEDTGRNLTTLKVADFKSSWYDTSPKTLQRKGQAILACSHRAEIPDRLVLQTMNLRRLEIFTCSTDDVEEDLDRWRAELVAVLDRADEAAEHHDVESAARPGPSCSSCPYLNRCGPGQGYGGKPIEGESPELALAVRMWGQSTALAALLKKNLIDAVDREGMPLSFDSQELARGSERVRSLSDNFHEDIWKKWFSGLGDPEQSVLGLLKRLHITVGNVESLIKTMDPLERGAWKDWLRRRVEVSTQPDGVKVTRREQ